jgi:hypothetical protein
MEGPEAAESLRQIELRARRTASAVPSFTFTGVADEPIDEMVAGCYQKFGFRPISFSSPLRRRRAGLTDRALVSDVIPGRPYSFDSETEYYSQYERAAYAVTHRKAGWDCFRHLEILSCGAIPLMPDADQIPAYTMVHYPREFLRLARRRFMADGSLPDETTYAELGSFYERHLTTAAMARYIFASIDHQPTSVLFLDEALAHAPDYLSMMTLIGVTQMLGTSCHVHWLPEYLYSDWQGAPELLYGRGFGYARRLDAGLRAASMPVGSGPDFPDLDEYDVVVVGSLDRNRKLAERLSRATTSATRIYVFGEDRAPFRSERRWIASLAGHAFVREIY